MKKLKLIYDCEHQFECRVRKSYREFCYLEMTDKQRASMGMSCPIADEYKNVPEPINEICPTGLMRKLISGKNLKGKKL